MFQVSTDSLLAKSGCISAQINKIPDRVQRTGRIVFASAAAREGALCLVW